MKIGESPTKSVKFASVEYALVTSLPFFFFSMVKKQYYFCGLHNATLIEKSPGRWNFNVDKTNKKLTVRKILHKYLCEVLSFLEQNIDDVEYIYCSLLRTMKRRDIALLTHQSPKGIYVVQKVNRKK